MSDEVQGTEASVETEQAPAQEAVPTVDLDQYVPKEKVPDIIKDRLARDREASRRALNEELASLGIEGGLDGLKQTVAQKAAAERKAMEEQNKWEELYRKSEAEKERMLAEKDAVLQQTIRQQQDAKLNSTLMEAASTAVAPQQVAALIRNQVKLDESGNAYVVDDLGQKMTDGEGNILSVKGYVDRFLNKNPHFRKAAPGTGTQRGDATNDARPPANVNLDFDRARTDPEYRKKHRSELLAAAQRMKR